MSFVKSKYENKSLCAFYTWKSSDLLALKKVLIYCRQNVDHWTRSQVCRMTRELPEQPVKGACKRPIKIPVTTFVCGANIQRYLEFVALSDSRYSYDSIVGIARVRCNFTRMARFRF